jgi:pyruvate dehydrogenase E2 component (dihydrolipoamide acetyltransferase)
MIIPVKMPKWGLSMQEGMVVHWWKAAGETVIEGEDLVDIETTKITNTAEAPASGVLRRIVVAPDETVPVGALIAVMADAEADEAEIETFVADFQASFVPEAEGEEAEGGPRLQTVQAGGVTLQAGLVAGEGDPTVLLHGFSGDLSNWLFNIEALAGAGPVVAFDLPGHGASAKDVGDGSLPVLASTVAAALDTLGVARAHLVGHSLGAAVAMQLALERPGLARSLTLIAPAGLPGTEVSEDFLTAVVEAQRPRELRTALERVVADPALVSKDMVEAVMRFKRLDGAEEALALLRDRMIDGADFRALQGRLAELPPALIIASHADQIVGAPDPARLPAGWRVAWIDGAGHMPHLEKAPEVNDLILKAIAGGSR